MAMTASEISYSGIESLVSDLEGFSTTVKGHFDILIGKADELSECYSGEAANAFKAALNSKATELNSIIAGMITTISTAAEENKAKYQTQDENLVIPTTSE